MRIVSVEDVRKLAVESLLGSNAEYVDLDSVEAVSEAIRRAASFACPTSAARLLARVRRSLAGLVDDNEDFREMLNQTLDRLIGVGDLMELAREDLSGAMRTELFLAPPGYVRRKNGSALLLGVRPDGAHLVGDDVGAHIEHERHVRWLSVAGEGQALLDGYGLREVAAEEWLRPPRAVSAVELIRSVEGRLSVAAPANHIDGLTVIDPLAPSSYYRGRWRGPSTRDTGRFVARRPQAYGADIWCYAQLNAGLLSRFVDFPLAGDGVQRGCDDAWRLQAALDRQAGRPQIVGVASEPESTFGVLTLQMPPPSWLQRRWDALGTPTQKRGALVAYRLGRDALKEESEFAATYLWCEIETR